MKKIYWKPGFVLALALVCLIFSTYKSHAQESPNLGKNKIPHRVNQIDTPIRIDGVLDEEAWQKALKLELKYELVPGDNIPAVTNTEVYIAYSLTHLYVAFRAYDPNPAAIRGNITDRDKIWSDDWVAITMDTFNENRRRYSFFCNPLGVQAEMVETMRNERIPWDAIWESAGRIVDIGYIVEMAIPFNSLRFQRTRGEQIWGFDAERSYPRDVRHVFGIAPIDRNFSCYMCQAERMIGFKGVKAATKIELDPTLSALLTQKRENFTSGKFVKDESKLDPGLTARWNVTPNLILGGIVNPDFSNVEADIAQLDINAQFSLLYPEKRPFFLEGGTIFGTRLPVAYTRALADPNWGSKLTGKEGKHALGFYSAQDNITNLLFPSSMSNMSTSLDMNTIGSVLRYRLDTGVRSNLGFMVTDREGEDYYNRVLGLDADLSLSLADQVQVQLLASQTRYPGDVADQFAQSTGKIDGSALDVYYKHYTRKVGFFGLYQQVTPDFRADMGFMPQAGYRYMAAGFDYSWILPPGHWYNQIMLGPSFDYETDFDDNLIYKTVKFTAFYSGPAMTELTLTGSAGEQNYLGKIFNTDNVALNLTMQPSNFIELVINGSYGNHIDFVNAQAGKRILMDAYANLRPSRHIAIGLSQVFERFNLDAGQLYTANVSYVRLIYQFSRRAFLRTLLQYVDYKYNVEYYTVPTDPRFKHFFSQVLFSYKINPQTVLFLGYSDDHYGFQLVPLTQTNRTFFLKIGYAVEL